MTPAEERAHLITLYRSEQITPADFYARCEADPELRKEWARTKMTEGGGASENDAMAEPIRRKGEASLDTSPAVTGGAIVDRMTLAEELSAMTQRHTSGGYATLVRLHPDVVQKIVDALERQPREVTPAEQGAGPHRSYSDGPASAIIDLLRTQIEIHTANNYTTSIMIHPDLAKRIVATLSSDESALREKPVTDLIDQIGLLFMDAMSVRAEPKSYAERCIALVRSECMEEAAKIIDGRLAKLSGEGLSRDTQEAALYGARLALENGAAAIRSAAQKTGGGR